MDSEGVECANNGCEIVLLKSAWGGKQYCSIEHREIDELKESNQKLKRQIIEMRTECNKRFSEQLQKIRKLEAEKMLQIQDKLFKE